MVIQVRYTSLLIGKSLESPKYIMMSTCNLIRLLQNGLFVSSYMKYETNRLGGEDMSFVYGNKNLSSAFCLFEL